ncbi:MAG: choice-of-anchor tandem repeat GloVer-containing protein [Candidatus Cybelea sp.]
MRLSDFGRFALSGCVAAIMLAACGGSQPPIGAPAFLQNGEMDGAQYSVLHAFKDKAFGYAPQAVITANGRLYGLTFFGGYTEAQKCGSGCGVLFSMATDGSAYKVLHRFMGGSDGAGPIWIFAKGSSLYGVTYEGGGGACKTQWFTGCGTAFHIGLDGSSYSVLHRFSSPKTNGSFPSGLAAFTGELYGTTFAGGKRGYGTVFRMDVLGADFSIVHSFAANGDGASPNPELAVLKGTLFGTTMHGGTLGYDDGTIFSVSAQSLYKNVYNAIFGMPYAGVVPVHDHLFGTTITGGLPACLQGCGTIYRLAPNGEGFKILRKFNAPPDAVGPQGNLVVSAGMIYGVSTEGGAYGEGTVFRVSSTGSNYEIVYSFKGKREVGSLGIIALAGKYLYGTAGGKGGAIWRLAVP